MASLLVAALALVFTVTSFWWLNARRGRLVGYEPQVYATYIIEHNFRLRLPLTFYNTGARFLPVVDLRAIFVDQGVEMPVITFRHSIRPLSGDMADFAHPFAVPGRQAVSRFVEFGRSDDWTPEVGTKHRLRVEARTGDNGKWSEVATFELVLPPADKARSYIAHRRDPGDEAAPPSVWSEP